MASLKLHYFELPGRAETTRLILNYGKIPFEDRRFGREDWAAFKPTTPFGQVPVLEVDGLQLAQSTAIERYVAHLAGLLPSDPLKAAQAEQWAFFMGDVMQLFIFTFRAEDKVAARKPIVEGPFKEKLAILEKHLEGKTYLLGEELTYADLAVFHSLSQFACGWLEGIPTDYLNDFSISKAYRNRIASLPAVKAMYENATLPIYQAYKPDA